MFVSREVLWKDNNPQWRKAKYSNTKAKGSKKDKFHKNPLEGVIHDYGWSLRKIIFILFIFLFLIMGFYAIVNNEKYNSLCITNPEIDINPVIYANCNTVKI